MTKQEEEVLAVIRRIVETSVDYTGTVEPNSDLVQDLRLDSVSRTIVLSSLEGEYEITLDAPVVEDVKTIAQLVTRVIELVGSK